MRWTEADYLDYEQRRKSLEDIARKNALPVPKKSKYGNHKVTVDGIKFDSKREAARWQQLRMMERAGKITDLQWQVPFILAPSVVIQGRKRPALRYVADFTYQEDGQKVVEDSKGMKTKEYIIKRHLMAAVHGVQIREV